MVMTKKCSGMQISPTWLGPSWMGKAVEDLSKIKSQLVIPKRRLQWGEVIKSVWQRK